LKSKKPFAEMEVNGELSSVNKNKKIGKLEEYILHQKDCCFFIVKE